MKKFKYIIGMTIGISMLWSCTKDDVKEEKPSDINNITSFEKPGEIGITWNYEEPKNIEYIKFSYLDKRTGIQSMRLASSYADTIIIPKTLKRLGDYEFTIQPFSSTHTGGNVHTLSAISGPAPITTTIRDIKRLTLDADKLYTDSQEPSEGPIKNLIDGDNGTFFHARWSGNPGPMPHYIVVDLGTKVKGFSFSYVTRNNGGAANHPKKIGVYVSNEFDGNTYDVSQIREVAQIDSGLPNGASQAYTSENYILKDAGEGYRYIWFQVQETHGGRKFFALAELEISELELEIVNPEAEPTSSKE